MESLIQIQNSLSVDKGVPRQIMILPLGLIKSQKGDFFVDQTSYASILQYFKDRRLDIPIDYEHQTLEAVQAPAAGWIKALSLKTDGIFAEVEWTSRALEYLKNKEYRYLSPVIQVEAGSRRARMLHSVGLTNTPAIDGMVAIVNSSKPVVSDESGAEQEESAEDFIKTIISMLQLPEMATFSEIKDSLHLLLDKQVELKVKVEAMNFESHKQKIDDAVLTALKSGKISAAQRDWAFNSAMNDYEGFTMWLKNAPQFVPMGEFSSNEDGRKSYHPHSRANELMGLSREDINKYGKDW